MKKNINPFQEHASEYFCECSFQDVKKYILRKTKKKMQSELKNTNNNHK